ncbi:MAG: hypothetical protein WDL87_04745 [Candidatus Omnitrophota bacterium]|jgi:hypothetical protein
MKKITLVLSVFLLIGCVSFNQAFAEPESKDKTSLGNIKMKMSGGVKFVPSKSNIIFSEEDEVYTYYTYEHDATGRTTEKRCYNIGTDKIKSTSDDTLKYHLAYEYDKNGKLIRDICYNGRGADNLWFTPDDVETYHSVYEYDSFGNKLKVVRYTKDGLVFDYTAFDTLRGGAIVKDVVYKGKGLDDQWFTQDDGIEKYHRFEYDHAGNLLRAMEYHIKQNGLGEDGIWFTADDAISSTKVFSYSAKGLLVDIKKYVGSGADNIWFTRDDVPQYYTVYTYTDKVYPGDAINNQNK